MLIIINKYRRLLKWKKFKKIILSLIISILFTTNIFTGNTSSKINQTKKDPIQEIISQISPIDSDFNEEDIYDKNFIY